MRLHILGVCGTFMGGVAVLARELGHDVEGSDANVYPPMSTQLETLGIHLHQGYDAAVLQPAPDIVVVGNALSRGNPAIEYMLNHELAYTSGPQWLGEQVLAGRQVLAVAGTHGKTTTSSLLAHLLDYAGRAPGFLIGGVPGNFGVSARLGNEPLSPRERGRGEGATRRNIERAPGSGFSEPRVPSPESREFGESEFSRDGESSSGSGFSESRVPSPESRSKKQNPPSVPPASRGKEWERPLAAAFVIEADEYDTAFFDKRSKFVHYRPHIAVLNNLEYDHADIFPDLAAIKRQFHHLVRIVPGNGRLIVNAEDTNLADVLAMGCWTSVETFGMEVGDWRATLTQADGSAFQVQYHSEVLGEVRWSLHGRHNVMNALAALAAASAAGVDPVSLLPAFASFANVKRRMESLGDVVGVHVYDDFAHHPTAIASTLAGLRARVGQERIVVALEPRSNSMRSGAHHAGLAASLADADVVIMLHRTQWSWDAQSVIDAVAGDAITVPDVDSLLAALLSKSRAGDHVVFMSNGGFEDAPRRFVSMLPTRRHPGARRDPL